MIHTAGKVLTEKDLRAYAQCSEFWSRGGQYQLIPEHQIAKTAIESMLSHSVRSSIEEPINHFNKFVKESFKLNSHLLENKDKNQIREIHDRTTMYLYSYLKIFRPKVWVPVTGPYVWRIKVSKTPVDVSVSGIISNKQDQRIQCVYFSPYYEPHSKLNDPVIHLILDTYSRAATTSVRYKRPNAQVHIIYFSKSDWDIKHNVVTSNELSKSSLQQVIRMVKGMEGGYHFPLVPCRYTNCPFRSDCYPKD